MAPEQRIVTEARAQEELSSRIDELELLLQKSENIRRKQFFVSACALFAMIIILTIGILNLTNYFRNYPKRLLMREVFLHARPMLYTPWNIRANTPRERRILNQTMLEIERSLKAYMPQIRYALRQSVRSLQRHTFTSLRDEFERNLYASLQLRASRYLQEKNTVQTPAGMEKIRALNKALAHRITAGVFTNLEQALKNSSDLQKEIAFLRSSGQTALLAKEPKVILEERLLHSFLEILPETTVDTGSRKGKGISHE